MAEPLPLLIPHPALTHGRTQYALAKDEVNHVGEAIAFVVADDRYVAEDAVDRIRVTYDFLPAVVGIEAARAATAPRARRRARQRRRPGWSSTTATPRRRSPPRRTASRSTSRSSAARASRWRAGASSPAGTPTPAGCTVWSSTQTSTGVRGVRRRQAGPRPRPGRRHHPRRGRRVRRQDRAPVARGAARADGGAGAGPAGEVHRGPARALHLLRPRARPGAPRRGRLRRRRPAAGARRDVLARPRRLLAVRPDRADHHLDPAARAPTSRAPTACGSSRCLHQHRDRDALPRRRASAGLLRHGADHGRDRRRPRPRPGRGAGRQLHPARRVPLRPRAGLPGRSPARATTRATTRRRWTSSRRWSAGTTSRRCRRRRRPRDAASASGSPATSRAPASAPTRAPTSTSRPPARSRSPPASPPRARATQTVFAQIVADELGVPFEDVEVVDRRHPPDAVRRRHLRVAGRGDERLRGPARRAGGPGEGAAHRGRGARGGRRRPRDRRRPSCRCAARTRPLALGTVAVLSNPLRYAFDEASKAATQFAVGDPGKPPVAEDDEPGLEGTRLLLAAAVDLRLRHARGDRRDRPGHRRDQDPALRRGPRLRHAHQPDDRRGPDPRRRRAGRRRRALRADGVRRLTGSCSTRRSWTS